MLLDFVQGSFQKKFELLPFSPPKHRKPSDPEFIDINPKQSMFNMIRPTQTYLVLHLHRQVKRKVYLVCFIMIVIES